jgi:hypothetical protein
MVARCRSLSGVIVTLGLVVAVVTGQFGRPAHQPGQTPNVAALAPQLLAKPGRPATP